MVEKKSDAFMAHTNIRNEEDRSRSEPEREGDSEISLSSNDDFEIIGDQAQTSNNTMKNAVSIDGDDKKPSIVFNELFKGNVIKRQRFVPKSAHKLPRKDQVDLATVIKKEEHFNKDIILWNESTARINKRKENNAAEGWDECSSVLWKMLFIVAIVIFTFQLSFCGQMWLKWPMMNTSGRSEESHRETLQKTIVRQQRIIEKLENKLKSCKRLDAYSLPVRIPKERMATLKRKNGFNYHYVVFDWKKNDRGMAQQHLHLAFKQSNTKIYVYDHGPASGRHFAVGDRIIDIDGITFIKAVDVRNRILWSHHNREYFTSIIERPATMQAKHTVLSLLKPEMSSFSVVLSA